MAGFEVLTLRAKSEPLTAQPTHHLAGMVESALPVWRDTGLVSYT